MMNHPLHFYSVHDLASGQALELSENNIHIWYFSEEDLPYFSNQAVVLSSEELKVWTSYKHIESKNCYLIGHSGLRLILGRYLNISPGDLVFHKNQHGKLYLDTNSLTHAVNIQFNISHSGGHILIAFCCFSEIGIDLEQIYMHRQVSSIVKRFYHPDERLEFQEVPEDKKGVWFYHRWTVREAFLKAIGTGLSIEPESFYVEEKCLPDSSEFLAACPTLCISNSNCAGKQFPVDPDIHCFQIKKSQEDYSSWQIYTFSLFDDYIASICFS